MRRTTRRASPYRRKTPRRAHEPATPSRNFPSVRRNDRRDYAASRTARSRVSGGLAIESRGTVVMLEGPACRSKRRRRCRERTRFGENCQGQSKVDRLRWVNGGPPGVGLEEPIGLGCAAVPQDGRPRSAWKAGRTTRISTVCRAAISGNRRPRRTRYRRVAGQSAPNLPGRGEQVRCRADRRQSDFAMRVVDDRRPRVDRHPAPERLRDREHPVLPAAAVGVPARVADPGRSQDRVALDRIERPDGGRDARTAAVCAPARSTKRRGVRCRAPVSASISDIE